MSWQSVARGDVRHLRRSRMAQTVAALVVLATTGVVVGAIVLTGLDRASPTPAFADVMLAVAAILSHLVPLVALIGSYGAIISERKMGSIRFLLGLPNSRLDAYLGKFVSRSLLVLVPLVAGLLVAGVAGAVAFRGPSVLAFLGLLLPTIPYALIFVGFGLTISAAVDTETRAVVGIVGVLVVFRALWAGLQWAGLQFATAPGEYPSPPYDAWYYLVGRLNPINAYVKVTTDVINPGVRNQLITTPSEALGYPVLSVGFAVFAVLCWVAIAPWLGYGRFRDRDLP